MLINLTFKGEKATYEFASALSKFGVEVVKALGDGFQPIADVSAIAVAAMHDLVPVASNVAQLKNDVAEDKVAFLNAWLKAAEEMYEALVVQK